VPPNSSGLISEEDIQVLQEFSRLRNSIFTNNLAKNAVVAASSTRGEAGNSPFDAHHVTEEDIYTYWAPLEHQTGWILYIDLENTVCFNVLQVREPIQMGQRIISFHLDILNARGEWQKAVNGTTVGYKRLLLFPIIEARSLRLVIDEARADPLISYIGVHLDQYSNLTSLSDRSQRYGSKGVKFNKLKNIIVSSTHQGSLWVF